MLLFEAVLTESSFMIGVPSILFSPKNKIEGKNIVSELNDDFSEDFFEVHITHFYRSKNTDFRKSF